MSQVLGLKSDLLLDELLLGLMAAVCPPDSQMFTKFNFSQYLAEKINQELQ